MANGPVPVIGVMGGRKQVVFPGGGRAGCTPSIRRPGAPIWSFQTNPKGTIYKLGGLGTRNEIIATPVIFGDRVFISLGQDPEHGEGPSHLYAVDGTKTGDISDSGIVWHNADIQRAMSTVAIHDGVLYHCDLSGVFRAVDAATGKTLWSHDLKAAVWGSPYVVDGKVFIGNEDGVLTVFKEGRQKQLLSEINMGSSLYTTPVPPTASCSSTTASGSTRFTREPNAIRRKYGSGWWLVVSGRCKCLAADGTSAQAASSEKTENASRKIINGNRKNYETCGHRRRP